MKNKLTKKEALARRTAWALAVKEGRVIRFNNGDSFRSFPTIEARDAFIQALSAEIVWNIVKA